jgi:hypothetical protein
VARVAVPTLVPGAAGPGDLPSWLAGVIPEALALGPDGAPAPHRGAPLFSLLHPGYLARVGDWYAAVGAAITPFAPAPVVAWQIDGGTAAAYAGRLGRLDFNEDTVARYNDFLKEQYETTRRLSRAWRRDVPELGTVRPPRDLHSHGELADWQAFLETWVAQYLTRLGQLAGASGVDLPRAAGDPVEYLSPVRPALTASRVDLYGFAGGAGGAFGGSLGAAHFEPFRAETRPLTGWQIGCRGGDERSRLREGGRRHRPRAQGTRRRRRDARTSTDPPPALAGGRRRRADRFG